MDTGRSAQEAVKAIEIATRDLMERGDVLTLEELLPKLASALGVPTVVFDSITDRAQATAEQLRAAMGKDLHDCAEKAGCDAEFKPPYVSVGCVTYHEKPPGEWSLSILDSVVIDTIRTTSGDVLVEHAVQRIKNIESALGTIDSFSQDLKIAHSAICTTRSDPAPANLLMLLCSHGKSLRRLLSSSEKTRFEQGFSRAQFGYMLSCLAQRESSGGVRLIGATQHDTKSPQRYIAVPNNPDPRRTAGSRRVSAISITY